MMSYSVWPLVERNERRLCVHVACLRYVDVRHAFWVKELL